MVRIVFFLQFAYKLHIKNVSATHVFVNGEICAAYSTLKTLHVLNKSNTDFIGLSTTNIRK